VDAADDAAIDVDDLVAVADAVSVVVAAVNALDTEFSVGYHFDCLKLY
jgi:hypothetical protein